MHGPLLADMRGHGATASELEAARARIDAANPPPRIWPCHWHAWCVFAAMGTQWRRRADGALDGLDYAGLPPVLQEHRRRLPRRLRQPLQRLMPQLRALENAALVELRSE
jgi:hypothetical protein